MYDSLKRFRRDLITAKYHAPELFPGDAKTESHIRIELTYNQLIWEIEHLIKLYSRRERRDREFPF